MLYIGIPAFLVKIKFMILNLQYILLSKVCFYFSIRNYFKKKILIWNIKYNLYWILNKGETKSLNIFELENSKNEKIYCFLSFYFAFIADVDIHSEL